MSSILAACLARLPTPKRLAAFAALEKLASLRQPLAVVAPTPAAPVSGERCLWVFVSTIGELNAIEPFLNRLRAVLGDPPLLLISDRSHYADAFRSKYPQAGQACLSGSVADSLKLAKACPPLLLLVAEIPCRLHDAPCRFAYASVHAAREAGAPVVLANGWLYGYVPPSRMDALENLLFAADYLQAFELILVQTEAVRQALIQAGAASANIVVTGNVKFDALTRTLPASPSRRITQAIGHRAKRGPVIVAGSVTETSDQQLILRAYARLQRKHPNALLVLAPRHPENLPRMSALRELLESSAFAYRWRSQHHEDAAVDTDVLVLDTIGELRDCYTEATLAFVGKDHNVLEPMAFGKPVFVGPGWEPTYPSYPVYKQLLDSGALNSVDTLEVLGEAWLKLLDNPALQSMRRDQIASLLGGAAGATERNLEAMRKRPRLAALMGAEGPRS